MAAPIGAQMSVDGGKNHHMRSAATKTFIANVSKNLSGRARLVWVQGVIVETNLSRNEITLKDETGSICVDNISSNTELNYLTKDAYCMVIGRASDSSSKIHCVKLTDLSKRPLEKQVWSKLVIHQQIYFDL